MEIRHRPRLRHFRLRHFRLRRPKLASLVKPTVSSEGNGTPNARR